MPAPDVNHLATPFIHTVCAALLLAVLMPAGKLRGAPLPVVFVVDAAMSQQDLTAATEVTLETSSQLADETAFSIVVYDDVIQKVVPLDTMGTERLALIKQTLDDTDSAPTSNLAAGVERAQDELKKLPGGRIILFTSAQINTETTDSRARYLEWYTNVLLPDAAEQGLELVFVTSAVAQGNTLLQLAQSYQNTRIVALQPSSNATIALLELLNRRSAEPGTEPVTEPVTEPSIEPPGNQVATPPVSTPTVSTPPADKQTVPADTEAPVVVTDADGSANTPDATPAVVATDPTDAASISGTVTVADAKPGLLQNRRMLHIIWYACLVLALLCLCGWLLWTQRQRKLAQKPTVPAENNQTGSAYLPLNEMPSRRFDSLANSIDEIEPYEQWTAKPRTARQANPASAPRPPKDQKQ